MKTTILATSFLLFGSYFVLSQSGGNPGTVPEPTAFRVVDIGANHRVWQREIYEIGPGGRIVSRPHRYQELATGLNYQDAQGRWAESKELIETYMGGAIARQGQYQVIFANNLNSNGAIDQQTPEGQRLRSNILGLAFTDKSSGQSVLSAQIQDAYGELIGANQVLYRNAFSGVQADIRYTYKKASFEQDILIRAQLPTPESYGLKSETTELEVLTEFLNPPREHGVNQKQLDKHGNTEQSVSWGRMRLGNGRAFDMGQVGGQRKPVAVHRQYDTIKGRKILRESVPVKAVQASLRRLPTHAAVKTQHPLMANLEAVLPKTPLALMDKKSMKLATAAVSGPAFVMDYVELNTDAGDYTFQSDVTYYISSPVNFEGAVTLEGGTVIKCNPTDNAVTALGDIICRTGPYRPAIFTSVDDNAVGEVLSVSASPACTGELSLEVVNQSEWNLNVNVYDPSSATVGTTWVAAYSSVSVGFTAGLGAQYYFEAYDDYANAYYGCYFYPTLNTNVMTAAADGYTVTATENGSALCTPSYNSTGAALTLANGGTVHDVRISNFGTGIASLMNCTVINAQFVNGGTALSLNNATAYGGNLLMGLVGTAIGGQNYQAVIDNLTVDQAGLLTDDLDGIYTSSTLALTNALLTDVTANGVVPVTTNHCAKVARTGVYQTVGAGSYYLATNSAYRTAGTANINGDLLANLRAKTTYPPLVYSAMNWTTTTNFNPCIQRDTNASPSLGYHYDPLDYAFSGVNVKTNITFAAGACVAWFELPSSWGNGYGLSVTNGRIVAFNGTATAPCVFARYSTVQEGGNGNWMERSYPGGIVNQTVYDPANIPMLSARFTWFMNVNSASSHFRDGSSGQPIWVRLRDCEVLNGFGGYNICGAFTNCLLDRVDYWQGTSATYPQETFVNCTWHGGTFATVHWESGAPYWCVKVHNCAFDGTDISTQDPFGNNTTYGDFDYNAYLTGATHPAPDGTHNQEVSTFNWQSSWLGDYYLPADSSLIDQGSPTADALGLYHYTTLADQTKDGSSTADIGYHYVATDGNGQPLDTNGDSIPDYLEDANGNGLVDNGELGWNWADPYFRVWILQPRNNTLIP